MINPLINVYQLASSIKNFFYDQDWFQSVKLKTSVISVGNLSFGGTGKTPCIEFLATEFSMEYKVAIICRSYKADAIRPMKVNLTFPDKTSLFGDEACLLQYKLPQCDVWSGPRKFETALAAQAESPDIILIDDGFSHRQLKRNFDLVLIDSSDQKFYYREAFSCLRRANAILITKTHLESPEKVEKLKKKVLKVAPHLQHSIYLTQSKTAIPISKETPLFVFCGLGNADSFLKMVRNNGFQVVEFKSFPDHFDYKKDDQVQLHEQFLRLKKEYSDIQVLTTEKDLVKINYEPLRLVLKVTDHKIVIDDQDKVGLLEKIRSTL